jgi:uncharacterized membrane protein
VPPANNDRFHGLTACTQPADRVFVPSVPTPLSGAVYTLNRERVHPLNVSFTQAIKSVSRWGSGSKELVAAMKPANTVT